MWGNFPQLSLFSEVDLSPVDVGGQIPHPRSLMTIPDFIARCDRYCEQAQVSRTWLSKRLFNDTYRLRDLDAGATDVGVKRLEKALADLRALEADHSRRAA